ncbi:hypothetical protein SLA2020_447120 [Shorea laevis]
MSNRNFQTYELQEEEETVEKVADSLEEFQILNEETCGTEEMKMEQQGKRDERLRGLCVEERKRSGPKNDMYLGQKDRPNSEDFSPVKVDSSIRGVDKKAKGSSPIPNKAMGASRSNFCATAECELCLQQRAGAEGRMMKDPRSQQCAASTVRTSMGTSNKAEGSSSYPDEAAKEMGSNRSATVDREPCPEQRASAEDQMKGDPRSQQCASSEIWTNKGKDNKKEGLRQSLDEAGDELGTNRSATVDCEQMRRDPTCQQHEIERRPGSKWFSET